MNKYWQIMNSVQAPVGEIVDSGGPGVGQEAAPAPTEEGSIYGASDDQGATPGPGGKKDIPAEGGEAPDVAPERGAPTVEDFSDAVEEVEQPAEGAEQPVEGEEPVAEPVAPPTLKLDPETIAELRRGINPEPKVEQKAPAQMTSAQIKELLQPVEVTADTLKSMGFENATPEQVAGFQNFALATVKNSVAVAKVMIKQARAEVEAALGPIMQEREQASMEKVQTNFYSKFGALKKYEKIVKAAAGDVNPIDASGKQKSQDQIFKEVAALATKTLGEYGVKINLNGGQAANLGAGAPATGGIRRVPAPPKPGASGRSGGSPDSKGKGNDPQADIYKR